MSGARGGSLGGSGVGVGVGDIETETGRDTEVVISPMIEELESTWVEAGELGNGEANPVVGLGTTRVVVGSRRIIELLLLKATDVMVASILVLKLASGVRTLVVKLASGVVVGCTADVKLKVSTDWTGDGVNREADENTDVGISITSELDSGSMVEEGCTTGEDVSSV